MSRTIDLARIYFTRSELNYAENLFRHYYQECYAEIPPQDSPRRDQILVLMQIRMHLGRYDEAKEDLGELRSMIEQESLDDDDSSDLQSLRCDWKIWEAIWNMRTGHWTTAAKVFEELKESHTQSRVRVERDLALTYAYMGNMEQATLNIKLASKTLHEIPADPKDNLQSETAVSDAKLRTELKGELIRMTEAKIHLSAGQYGLALDEASDALNNLTRILGPKHLKTLTVANIKALC